MGGNEWCQAIVAATQTIGGRVRFRLLSAIKAEPWGHWLISPTCGYLENDVSGPYSILELAWVEVDPGKAGPELMVRLLTAAGVSASVVRKWVRVQVANAERDAKANDE
jgi:hypothetical protein